MRFLVGLVRFYFIFLCALIPLKILASIEPDWTDGNP